MLDPLCFQTTYRGVKNPEAVERKRKKQEETEKQAMTTSTSGGGGLRVSQLFVLGATDPSSKFNAHPILLVFFFFFQWQVG